MDDYSDVINAHRTKVTQANTPPPLSLARLRPWGDRCELRLQTWACAFGRAAVARAEAALARATAVDGAHEVS